MGKTFILSSSHFCTSAPSPNFLCCQLPPLFPLKHHGETPGDLSCIFVLCCLTCSSSDSLERVSEAEQQLSGKAQTWETSGSSSGAAELLGKATHPQGLRDFQALLRFSESSPVVLVGCSTGSLWHWHFLMSLLDAQNHPRPAAGENCSFFSVDFTKTQQILLLYKEKRLFGCRRGV